MSEEGEKKKRWAATCMPASRQEAHLTQPIWSRGKASFQMWLRHVPKRRGSRTTQHIGSAIAGNIVFVFSFSCFTCIFLLIWNHCIFFTYIFFFGERITGSHSITLKSAKVDSTNVDWEEPMFSSWKADLHGDLRAPHTDNQSRHHSVYITHCRMLEWYNT